MSTFIKSLRSVLLASLTAAAMAQPAPKANPPVVFAQTHSDLPVDPAARFGRLPNGMTYVIYRNATPKGAASVWMRIAAGSIMEQEHQRGLAHFVEHMAFKGSRHVPQGDMVKILQRDGLRFGADTNAQTSHFQTLYTLDLPNASPRFVGDALFLMRETAGNLTFDPRAIDSERGVILGEERVRSTVDSRASEAQLKQLLSATAYPERMPIGLVDVIKTAQRPAFTQFYNDFYRPVYTTLIVVGDVDPDRVEADIRRRFSDWRPGPPSPAAMTDYGALTARNAPQAMVHTAEGLVDAVSIDWVEPPSDQVETVASDVDDERYAIATTILNKRFARAAHAPGSSFAEASFQRENLPHTARIRSLAVRPKQGRDAAALKDALTLLRDYVVHGPTQGELDKELDNEDERNRDAVARERTLPTQSIAGLIVKALAEQGVVQSPAQGYAGFRAMRPALTLAAVRAAMQGTFDGAPLLSRQAGQATAFDETALVATYRAALDAPVTPFDTPHDAVWTYRDFGTPSAVLSRETLPGFDATRVAFANGATLTFKQTPFEENAVHVSVQVGSGDFGIRPDQGATLFMAKQVGLLAGGLGRMSGDDIGDALEGKVVGLDFTIAQNAAILSGMTTKGDLAVQLQVLTAFLSDPGFRPDALERVKAALPAIYAKGRTSPDGVYAMQASGAVYGDDPRFATPSLADALAVSDEAIAALVRDQLGHGPIDVTIVGDITLDEAIAQVAPTLGALAPLPPAPMVSGARELRFPVHDLHRVYVHGGRADQNLSVISWPTTDFYADPRRACALELLAAVLTMRELDEVRGRQSATYSASANSAMSRHFEGFGFMSSRATVRPEVDDVYDATVSAIADDLKLHLVTADELTRARQPILDHLRSERYGNGHWLALLSGTVRDSRQLAVEAGWEKTLLSVEPEELRSAARDYLDMSKALRIQVKPESVSK